MSAAQPVRNRAREAAAERLAAQAVAVQQHYAALAKGRYVPVAGAGERNMVAGGHGRPSTLGLGR